MMDIEVRSYSVDGLSIGDRHIEGYASVFNKRSVDLGGFTEIIAEGAFDNVIEKSDVKCYLDHDAKRGILARSRNGEGSLGLSIDEAGLKYAFDAPHTALGDEVVEGLTRGDYNQSSFAFTVESESWTKEEDGSYLRTINKIGNLYDVSIVANPAYPDTSVALRSLDAFRAEQEHRNSEDVIEVAEKLADAFKEEQEKPVEEPQEVRAEEETTEVVEVRQEAEEVAKEEETKPEENQETRNNINIRKNYHMSNFSLIKAINDVVNNRNINEDALNVIEMGAMEMRKSGLSYSGQIQLPVEERAATDDAIVATVETQGQEIVATDKLNILEPLRANSILAQCGATFLTGLVGNISIPVYSGTTCGWKGEMASADNGEGAFDTVELSPKRLTAYIDISKQFLVQDSVGAEEMLRRDIVNALRDKLEATIFGENAGDTTKPAGIFYGADEVNPSYAAVVEMEADLEDANYLGNKCFVMSPRAKAAFKQATISGELSDLRLLMQGNEVNGYPVYSSSNVAGYAYGDFSELVVAQWGAIDIVVDPYTLATKNAVRLVINAFFDAKVRREGAIVANILDEGSEA